MNWRHDFDKRPYWAALQISIETNKLTYAHLLAISGTEHMIRGFAAVLRAEMDYPPEHARARAEEIMKGLVGHVDPFPIATARAIVARLYYYTR